MRVRCATAVLLLAGAHAQAPATPDAPEVVLEGRVVDMRGEPVPLAGIAVTTSADGVGAAVAHGTADGDGYFRIGHVPASEQWTATAASEGRAAVRAWIWAPPLPLRIVQPDAATVRGVLRRRDGTAVVGAPVRAINWASCLAGLSVDGATDRNGRYELRGVALGPVEVAAVVPGEGLASRTIGVAADAVCDLAPLDAPTTTLQIRIVGVPVGQRDHVTAIVVPYGPRRSLVFPPPWDQVANLGDGDVIEWTQVPQVEYSVRPMAATLSFEPAELRMRAGPEPCRMQFTARPREDAAQQCRARVVDGQGKPLAGLRLGQCMPGGGYRSFATSADDGTLTFLSTVGPGSQTVFYSADERWVLGYQPPGGQLARGEVHTTFDPKATLELHAVPACAALGTVTLPDGQPAAYVRVVLEQCDERMHPVRWRSIARTTSDRVGHYRMGGLCFEGDLRVVASGPSGDAVGDEFQLNAGRAVTDVAPLRLRPAATVEGVLRIGGEPAPGIRVGLNVDKPVGPWSKDRLQVVTDRSGRFRFVGVPGGACTLTVRPGIEDEAEPHPDAEVTVGTFEVKTGERRTSDVDLPRR